MRRLAIVGSTASGKSSVALEVARQMAGAELLSVDAKQVYRLMDIGTAKPTAAEQSEVRHHLIDLVEPTEEFTVADFQRAAHVAATDLTNRNVPLSLAVGGTGLYLAAIVDRLEMPGSWPEIRARLEAEAEVESRVPALHERLSRLDPVAAAKMEPTNGRRVVRALEVCEGSGRPFSSFGPGMTNYPVSDVTFFGLRWDREVHRHRVAGRVHSMIERGLLDEVKELAELDLSRTARQALGYRELLDHLAGVWSLHEAIEAMIVRTQQFAARQDRWFRRDPRIRWIDVVDDPIATAVPVVLETMNRC